MSSTARRPEAHRMDVSSASPSPRAPTQCTDATRKGAVASMASVAKLPYEHSQDGISYTFSIVPKALGKTPADQVANLGNLLDGYFDSMGSPHQCERLRKGDALRCHGASREIPTVDRSGFRIRSQLHQTDEGATARRHHTDLPRQYLNRVLILFFSSSSIR